MSKGVEVWVDAEAVEFFHNGIPHYASSVVYHNCHKSECGIGVYEYQGAKECDNSYEYVSEFSEARFEDIQISTASGDVEASGEILERAKEAIWSNTRSSAEEQAWDV
jgi:hypothetical protein